MKAYPIHIIILCTLFTVSLSAEEAKNRYITHKSVMSTGRTMNNVTAIMECDGVKFVIPPDTIDPSLVVYLFSEKGELIVRSGKPSEIIVRLAVDTSPRFAKPVEIHIPMAQPDKAPVAYAVDNSDQWEPLKLKEVTADGSTAVFVTFKPVTVAWITPE